MDIPRTASLGTAYLLTRIDDLTRELDAARAEKAAALTALTATEAYAKQIVAERDELANQVRARLVEVHTLNARLLIAQGGQI